MKVEAIVIENHGGPENLLVRTREIGIPGPGELLVRHLAIAVNFHDCYVRSGLYRTLALPGVPGLEAVGIVEAIGTGVTRFTIGDRVGWISSTYGGYVSARLISENLAFKLDESLNFAQASASVMKAMTVQMLARASYAVQAGQTLLVHAAGGGVGQLLCSFCSHIGAVVIGTVGDEKKGEIAQSLGARHVINYRAEDFVKRVLEITDGEGVSVVFDSVGADTITRSLSCLAYAGVLVSYGQSSGAPPPVELAQLAERSLTVTRPILFHCIRTPDALDAMAREVFAAFKAGVMHPIDPIELSLNEAADAHRLLEARRSKGGIVLRPETC